MVMKNGLLAGAGKRLVLGLAAGGMTLLASQLAGCVGYANYPPIDGNLATENPNSALIYDIQIAGLTWVSTRYSPQGDWVINFPEGMTRTRALQVLARVGDPDAQLLTQETQSLPIYHVTRIWVRGERAEMDVLRPVVDLLDPDGVPAYQPITLTIEGGLQRWRMKSFQTWTVGSQEPPALNFLDEPEDPEAEPEESAEDDPDDGAESDDPVQ